MKSCNETHPLRPLKGEPSLRDEANLYFCRVLYMKTNLFYGAGPVIFELAKKLRNNVTTTEMILWGRLKEYFPKLRFRRQHPISLYIADFYCHAEKLVIEIDGSIHDLDTIRTNDIIRQKDLEDLGLKVLRFTTKEITSDLESVLQKIEKSILTH